MLTRVRDFAARHALWSRATRVMAALSGGGDSVALFSLLRELDAAGDLRLAGACHVNHHIRGAEADADEAFCRTLAERAGLPLVVVHRDVPAAASRSGGSLEVTAREERRAALAEAATDLGADRIATGHTRDDQAETVLLRIARGTAVSGLGGIAPCSPPFVRPLLEIGRDELRDWLSGRGEAWRDDETNAELSIPRNRVRHELLPLIRAHFNPSADRALARLADVARAEDELLRRMAGEAALRAISREGDAVCLDRSAVSALPVALGRRVARLALETRNPGRSYDFDEVELVYRTCLAASGGRPLALRGLRVERNRPDVVLLNKPSSDIPPAAGFHRELSVPGSLSLPEAGWVVDAEGPWPAARLSREGLAASTEEVVVAAERCGTRLIVRSRAPGDRIRIGRGGRTKLQDLFVNRKVSRAERDRIPIVTSADGDIVWVGGLAVADEFRVSDATKAVVVLKLRRI